MGTKGFDIPAILAEAREGLLTEKYILREGKDLHPTAKAFSLIALLKGLGVPELFSPELTAEWEFKLAQMEHGKLAREAFMREIVALTLNFWDGPLAAETLARLTRDDGFGTLVEAPVDP